MCNDFPSFTIKTAISNYIVQTCLLLFLLLKVRKPTKNHNFYIHQEQNTHEFWTLSTFFSELLVADSWGSENESGSGMFRIRKLKLFQLSTAMVKRFHWHSTCLYKIGMGVTPPWSVRVSFMSCNGYDANERFCNL